MSDEVVRKSFGTLADCSVREVGRAILNELDMSRKRIAELEAEVAELEKIRTIWMPQPLQFRIVEHKAFIEQLIEAALVVFDDDATGAEWDECYIKLHALVTYWLEFLDEKGNVDE